ncbi:MAG: aldehyde reductase [Bacteroidota bacterium]
MKKEKVLVSGVTGFLGSHLSIQLLNQGYQVVGSLRSQKRAPAIREVIARHSEWVDHLSFVEADLNDAQSWQAACKGMDFVQHIASPVPVTEPKDENEVILPARNGTLNLLRAAQDQGVKRVVLTSSVAAIGYGHHPMPKAGFTEEHWTNPEDRKDSNAYIRSKTLAERAAWEFVSQEDVQLELCTINPVGILGPVLEKDYGSSAEIVKKLMEGALPGAPKFGFGLVDVRDVADLHIRAMRSPEAAGERFICGNEFSWMLEVSQILRKHYPAYARKLPRFNLPNFAIRFFSLFDPEVRSLLFELGKLRVFDNSKAKKILKWEPRSNEEAILATAESLIAHQLV